jgi:hypothetical protein
MDEGPLTLARHLSCYGYDVFTEAGQEHELDVAF